MTELMAAVLCSLAAALAGGIWWTRLARVLPLERALARAAALAERRTSFALVLLGTRRSATTPSALSEAAQVAADAFLERFAGVDIFAWTRQSGKRGEGELIFRSGPLEAMEAADLVVPETAWDTVFETRVVVPWDAPGGMRGGFLRPWGARGKVWGVLGAVQGARREGDEDFLAVHAGALDALAAHLDAAAERAAQFWELEKARVELEGGLDATARRLDETNVQLIRRAKEVRTFQEVTDAITRNPEHAGVLAAIVAIVANSLDADLCAFLLHDEATGELVTQPGGFGLSNDEGSLYRISLANDQSSSVRVFKTGEPFITADAQSDPLVIARYARLWRCHSLVVVPLILEGRRIGVLRVGSFKKTFFTPDDVRFVSLLGEEAAVLIESAMLSKKLADSNTRLAEMHRLKDDFVSTVSHEFKTPLTSILGFLSVILEGEAGPLNPEQRRFLGIVRSSAQRLSSLVSDILDLSKLEEGVSVESAAFDLAAAARKTIDEMRWRADEKEIRMELEAPDGLPNAFGSERWLSQVLENLLSNAVKFSRPQGRVRVLISHKGEGLQATVVDDGIGIPEADQPRIFEKFFRASNRDATGAPGTGLGLAICRHIVDRHNGRIWFESRAGAGTSFHFVVPAARAEEAAPRTSN